MMIITISMCSLRRDKWERTNFQNYGRVNLETEGKRFLVVAPSFFKFFFQWVPRPQIISYSKYGDREVSLYLAQSQNVTLGYASPVASGKSFTQTHDRWIAECCVLWLLYQRHARISRVGAPVWPDLRFCTVSISSFSFWQLRQYGATEPCKSELRELLNRYNSLQLPNMPTAMRKDHVK